MKYLAITAVLCLILAGASFAGNVTMTEVLTGGNLTLTMPSNFSFNNTTLGGAAQNSSNIIYKNYTVEDSRGTGAGWNLGLQINQFTTAGTPARVISTSNFQILFTTDAITKVYGQDLNSTYGPKSTVSGWTTLPNSETRICWTAAGYGMGQYLIAVAHVILIDANIYAGTYTATLTATLNNTP